MEKWGHDVRVASDGGEAWRLFQESDFHVVVTDWVMPEMDGVDLVRHIRSVERRIYTYVLMLTSRAEKEDIVEGLDAGADDFISKPFDVNEMRSRLNAGERIITLEHTLAARTNELENAQGALEEVNRKMKADLEAGAKMQNVLLPESLPQTPGLEFAWTFRPCDELAGDLLNVFQLDEKRLGFYVLDVSGHGLPSALMAFSLHELLTPVIEQSSLLKQRIDDPPRYLISEPDAVARRLNRNFQIKEETLQYFTLIYAILDKETHMLRYTQAGHPSPILLASDGSALSLEGGGLPVGIVPGAQYEIHERQVEPGERFYFFSDGAYEAMRGEEMFGLDRLSQAIVDGRSLTLQESLQFIVKTVEDFLGDPSRILDDVSLLAFEVADTDAASPLELEAAIQ